MSDKEKYEAWIKTLTEALNCVKAGGPYFLVWAHNKQDAIEQLEKMIQDSKKYLTEEVTNEPMCKR